MLINKQNLIYLAGLIDGDGCFNIGKCRTAYIPRIIIVNTNKEIMNWLIENFGGDITKTSIKNKPNWKDRYSWRLQHRKALDLAYELVDYLIIKKDAALVFCTWRASQDVIKPKERFKGYEYLKSELTKLNQKGIYAIA